MTAALNDIYNSLQHEDLPVRVASALALNSLLEQDLAVTFVKPGLSALLKTLLKIMDEIDFDELVRALENIVEVYEDEIAPYAVALCQKLGEAYMRLV